MRKSLAQYQKERQRLQSEYARSQQGRSLGIYIHIPFCRSKCVYCDFYSLADSEQRMEDYLDALLDHLTETAPRAAGYLVDTVYIGGGTPSIFGPDRIAEILRTVRRHYRLTADCEITMEANPDSVTYRHLKAIRRAGVNRLSLGVQSANDHELKLIGRPHDFRQAVEAVDSARKAGFTNLSLDLIYGIPDQTMESWQQTVEALVGLTPEHLSCYGLQLEEGTPLHERRHELTMADDDTQADMYLWLVRRLKEAGYNQYEISNFSRPGRESRHNLRYWQMKEYIGFGPGAHSDFGDRRYSFVPCLEQYIRGMKDGSPIVDEDWEMTEEERRSEYIMLSLRTVHGFDCGWYSRRYHMDSRPLEELLRRYADRGLMVFADGRWHFTPEGFLISNPLLAELLEAQRPHTVRSLLETGQQLQEKDN